MVMPERYASAIRAAGFTEASTRNRTPWRNVATREGMIAVLETGELCPHHLRGYKP